MPTEEVKVYHIPDWTRSEKGTSLTDYALCGQYTKGPQTKHWFAFSASLVNCDKCLEVTDGATPSPEGGTG